ncbi:I78 family peptidase inhibitor [Sphingomicrobium clamense]|uniref:Serine protease inhibitor n=1 Tax=Sphingomicrobium clamense TaxID=2851013 RepID=A0ABS6V5Z3_9SPHN|nr:I78 family peptidase inhibitor [Sphingomicrobium sp. B8]MBW0144992.1 serine protease inhibitor [Sphingomicrobium sp. B8]
MRIVMLTALPLVLTACMANVGTDGRPVYANVGKEEPRVRGGDGGVCNQDALMAADGFVGRTASTELAGEMMQLSGATKFQWVPKDSAVTMDYRPDRLRVQLDENNVITSHTCG